MYKVIGTYYSVSNSSQLHVLYGSYWYVEDHDDEDSTYWIHVNKSTGNEWEHIVNSNYFINGINLIKVRISNNNSHFFDTIQIQVVGLPQTTSHQSEPTATTEPSNGTNSTSLSTIPPELLPIILVVSIVGSIILLKLRTRMKKQKILEGVTKDDHDVSDKISDLKGTIDKKSSDLEQLLIKEKGEEFIPDDSKKFRPRRRKR